MIGKISSGNSFGGCLDYITRVKQDNLQKKNKSGMYSGVTVFG